VGQHALVERGIEIAICAIVEYLHRGFDTVQVAGIVQRAASGAFGADRVSTARVDLICAPVEVSPPCTTR